MRQEKEYKVQRARYESFGGIIGLKEPAPCLVFVDKEYMKEEGHHYSPLWESNQDYLTAPTEVHFNVTNNCPLNCNHCTSGSGSQNFTDMSGEQIKEYIDVLNDMNVFHIAFGGGEFFSRPDAIELANYAASKGIIPNATTNGFYMTPQLAKECRIFGQINVSLDGIGDNYGIVRGENRFDIADSAIRMLVDAGVETGINCIVTSANFDFLEEVLKYADRLKLKEVLFLRLKPSGRAKDIYHKFKLTNSQSMNLYPFLRKMSKKYKPNLIVDCSFISHVSVHKPSKKMMNFFGITGCEGGNILLGVRHDGWINACSHYEEYLCNLSDLNNLWNNHQHFKKFRERNVTDERCRSCEYYSICKGGCPLFSEFITGDFNSPDPECPKILKT